MKQAVYIKSGVKINLPDTVRQIDVSEIDSIDHDEIAIWLIDMRIWQDGWKTLCEIRRNLSPKIYLKPVVSLVESMDMPEEIKLATDGYINNLSLDARLLEDWVSRMEHVNHWIEHVPNLDTEKDTNIAFKVLRIITSRNIRLEPTTTIRRSSGYVYPILEPLFSKRDAGVMETLAFLESQHLLTGEFVSRAHHCGHCGSAFLNFKESCPQCSSDDINVDELVHHFKCAYTAEISEFKHGDRLVCPKCERELRHIGVDYDKPSIIYQCNQCAHSFQDPKIMTACYNCGRTAEPELQDVRVIQSYTVSAIGMNAAEFGLDALFTSILDTELRLFSAAAFSDFYNIEKARIRRYKKSASSLTMIRFQDLDDLYIRLGGKARDVFAELSLIFKNVLRQSDVITARNESVFFVIMTETPKEMAARAVERLQEGMQALFESNLDFTPHMQFIIKDIDEELDLDETLEAFLNENVDR